MLKSLSKLAATTLLALGVTAPTSSHAYQVDCAILLCLSGGWPASAECAHAKAVFIRRITPVPVEPPLQIWRCPMGVAANSELSPSQRLRDLAFKDAPPVMDADAYHPDPHHYDTLGTGKFNNPQPVDFTPSEDAAKVTLADLRTEEGQFDPLALLQFVNSQRADIDMSGPEFDYVRSIRVYDVRYYRHGPHGREGECRENYVIYIGTYGDQGEFRWDPATPPQVPSFALSSRTCDPASYSRGVGVEWRSYGGEYGNEYVTY